MLYLYVYGQMKFYRSTEMRLVFIVIHRVL